MQAFLRATYVALVSVSLISLAACSKVDFGRSGKSSKRTSEERAGGQNNEDCLKLGNPDAGKDGGGKDGTDVVVVPGKDGGDGKDGKDGKDGGTDYTDGSDGKGEEPNPPAKDGDDDYNPCQNPGQTDGNYPGQTDGNYPGQSDGKDGNYPGQNGSYEPSDSYDNNGPGQYPTQKPIGDDCGKDGKYCDDGGPGQYPKTTCKGGSYDQRDIDSCMEAFRHQGYDTRGQWNVDVRSEKNVSVLSNSIIEDRGNEHTIVIIKSVSVLGSQEFRLLNPNALYCINSVSVLQEVRVTSCHQNNVVWGKDINVLSGVQAQTVNCQ